MTTESSRLRHDASRWVSQVLKPCRLARSWAVGAWLSCALALLTIAVQLHLPEARAHAADPGARVEHHVLIDDTQTLTLQDVRARAFSPLNWLQRLPMGGKTTWLKLTINRADGVPGHTGPLYLRLLPSVLDSVILHTPDTQAAGGWRATELGHNATSKAIALGELPTSDPIFLQISSSYATGLLPYAGTLEEVSAYNQKLAVTVAVISTMLVITWVIVLWKAFTHFSQVSLAICVFLPAVLVRFWVTLGYGPELLNLPPRWEARIYVPLAATNVVTAGWAFIALATAIFQGTRRFVWLWCWAALAFFTVIIAFFHPGWAIRLIDALMLCGALLFMASMALAALKSPKSLESWPAKLAFVTLILTSVFGLLVALQLQGLSLSPGALQQSDSLMQSLLLRAMMPIALIVIANWTFERIRSDRESRMQAELLQKTASLELESRRLERQRNFTAMLAHELKNPLTASEMALSGIQKRLASDDPVQQRAEKIKTSLQEINAIVDRCAEVDGYEQGQMPMAVHSFSVQHLLDLVQGAHPSERIYTLMRDVPEGATLTSDLQYIKVILTNLLGNALKYSPPDSLVELQLSRQDARQPAQLVISVSNEIGSAGVPEQQRLFERFYRTEGARNQSGAGLGLWLSQALAEALGTRIVSHTEDNSIRFTLALNLDHATG